MSAQRVRRGFSMIDLLVAIAMLLFLAALLLPAVQNLRQAGYKAETVNNLKQILLGTHICNDNHNRLPPAFDKFADMQFPAALHVHLLPYMERAKLYKEFDKQMGKGGTADAEISTFRASEDGSAKGEQQKGVQNFAANLRAFAESGRKTEYNKNMPALKAVEPGAARIPASFPDGTSNTIIFATKIAACGEGGSKYAAEVNSKFAAFFGQNAAQKPAPCLR